MFSDFFETVPNGNERYIDWIIEGLGWTIALALLAWVIAFALGTIVGAARTAEHKGIRLAARAYVETFRNIPLIVQMFLWFFVLPELLPASVGGAIKRMQPPWASFVPALICLGTYTASRVAEQVRSGINALPRGQLEAALALGLSRRVAYRAVVLPQALRIVIPTLTSEVMAIFKNTSVALTIGLLELTAQARQISEFTFKTFEAFAAATAIYLLIAFLAYRFMLWIEQRVHVPGFGAPRGAKA